jgi:hypothetical protein
MFPKVSLDFVYDPSYNLLLAHVADSLSPADPSMQVLFIHVFGHMVGAARTEITPVIRTLHERLVT